MAFDQQSGSDLLLGAQCRKHLYRELFLPHLLPLLTASELCKILPLMHWMHPRLSLSCHFCTQCWEVMVAKSQRPCDLSAHHLFILREYL